MGDGPFPALIPMTFFSFGSAGNYGSLPASVFASRPIATVDFVHNNVSLFGSGNHSNDPFYRLYPELCAGTCNGNVSNSGQYAAWSWGVSRLIDGIEIATRQDFNPLPIDMNHLAVTGCSYAGKMALFAGALDERIALTIPQESGGGGAPAWRITHEIEAYGASEDIQRTDYNWFAGQMRQFSGDNGYKLPTDHHELMALVAPRGLLATGNTDFYWLSNRANYITARATQEVYNTLGIGDRFGFYIDGRHGHCATLPEEAPAIAAFVDKFLLGDSTVNTDVEVNPYPALDYSRWTAWWGKRDSKSPHDWNSEDDADRFLLSDSTADTDVEFNSYPALDSSWGIFFGRKRDPKFPNNWNPGDGSVIMSMIRPIEINSGDTVLAGYDLSVRGDHPAATVSLAGGNVQADVSCPDGSSYTLTIPLPDQAYSIPANDDSWFPSPNHRSQLVYQGSTTASSVCSGGVAKRAYFSALGVSAGVGNPPAAPGFSTTDTTYPLKVRFHLTTASHHGHGGSWSPTVTINYTP
jgi:hypothetical protein